MCCFNATAQGWMDSTQQLKYKLRWWTATGLTDNADLLHEHEAVHECGLKMAH